MSPTPSGPMPRTSRAQSSVRAAVAIVIGVLAAAMTARFFRLSNAPPDFTFPYEGARRLAAGVNPYRLAVGSAAWPYPYPLFYPLPALIVVRPLAAYPIETAAAVFIGVSSAALAWRLTRDGSFRLLLLFVSGSFLMATRLGQWTPALCLAALAPGAGWIAAGKPTIGLAMLAARPTWRGIGLALGFAVACLFVLPTWPLDWLAALRTGGAAGIYVVPAATAWGWPLLAAIVRWRQPEARLLLAMALVPQLPVFADQLALALVARTRVEALAFSCCNLLAWSLWLEHLHVWTWPAIGRVMPLFVAGTYLPALVIVLLRPDDGAVPAWMNRIATGRMWSARRDAVARLRAAHTRLELPHSRR